MRSEIPGWWSSEDWELGEDPGSTRRGAPDAAWGLEVGDGCRDARSILSRAVSRYQQIFVFLLGGVSIISG